MSRPQSNANELRAGALPEISHVAGLVEEASDIAVYLGASGLVEGISVNRDSPALGSLDHWVGRPFEIFVAEESKLKLENRLASLRGDPDARVRPMQITHVDNATWEFPVRYTLHRVDENGAVLLLGRDMQPIAEIQQRLVSEQSARARDQQRLRGEETFYRVVLEASETPLVIVEPEKGLIRDLNSAAAALLGTRTETLGGNVFSQAFEGRRRGELMEALQSAAGAEGPKGVEVVARRNARVLSLIPEFFRAAGELFVLCRIVPADDNDSATPEMAQSLVSLFDSSTDAIILADSKGVIRDANEAFLVMADAARLADVKNESLSEFLARGNVDLKLILETTTKNAQMRGYATQLHSVVGTRSQVDIAATRLDHRGGDLGYGLVIRDISARGAPEQEAGAAGVMSEEAMKNVMDLVGTASLKELVAATSDVVEKMCIETAVQLTNNNRVAAAEMLGLSRQSLYVKLRKHGLITATTDE